MDSLITAAARASQQVIPRRIEAGRAARATLEAHGDQDVERLRLVPGVVNRLGAERHGLVKTSDDSVICANAITLNVHERTESLDRHPSERRQQTALTRRG